MNKTGVALKRTGGALHRAGVALQRTGVPPDRTGGAIERSRHVLPLEPAAAHTAGPLIFAYGQICNTLCNTQFRNAVKQTFSSRPIAFQAQISLRVSY